MDSRKLSSIAIFLLVLLTTATSACGQQKPKRMVRGPSVRELVPEAPNDQEDGISRIIFGQIFKEGETEYRHIGSGALKDVPPLPTEYVLFRDLVFQLKTEAVTSGYQLTIFRLPSAESQQDFDRLSILHLEDDEMSPSGRSWVPVKVSPGGWQAHFHSVSKAQYAAVEPDFKSKRISALTNQFGLFLIALAPATQPLTGAFTTIEVHASSSPEPVRSGEEFSHSILVKNQGAQPAAEVNLKEEIHSDFDYVSVASSQGTCRQSSKSSGRVLCHLGALPAAKSATIKIGLRVRRNLTWNEHDSVSKSLNIIELIFKEKPTDFAVMENQIITEFTTSIMRER